MTTYRAGIAVRANAVDGWVFDLPGCRAIGASREETLSLLPVVIAEHLAWLKSHGEVIDGYEFDFEVVEEVESTAEFCFEADKAPVSAQEIEGAIRIMEHAQHDFLDLALPLPQQVLGWRPPVTAVKVELVPDARTVREIVEHAGGAEAFFLNNLSDEPPPRPAPDAEPRSLQATFESTQDRLRALSERDRGRVFHRTTPRGESEWTARKALRRLINHKRFHTKEIEQRLAWLLLAVPEVMPVSRE